MEAQRFWYCDSCGEKIESADRGYVEWIVTRNPLDVQKLNGRNLRIVHYDTKCYLDEKMEYAIDGGTLQSSELRWFVGPNGLMKLLRIIAQKNFSIEEGFEIIKRIHIPGYETAHRHFEEAIAEGVFEPNVTEGYYPLEDIQVVNEWLEKRGSMA